MKRFEEYTKIRFEIVLTTYTVLGGEFASEEDAMKVVPTMEKIFDGKFVRINRKEIPCNRWVED